MLAVNIAPQADAGSSGVGECEIHPTVFVEIESNDTNGGRKIFFLEIDGRDRGKFPFARIQINRCAVVAACKNEVNSAVVVEIRGDESSACGIEAKTAFGGYVGERAVAIVAPKNIVRRVSAGWIDSGGTRRVDDIQVEVAVVIVVHPRQADATRLAAEADFFGDVLEFSLAGIAKEPNAVEEADGEIGMAVVVEIAGRATEAGRGALEPRSFRDIRELSVSEIVEEVAAVRSIIAYEEDVRLAVVVVVEETGAVGRPDWGCRRRGDGR